MLERAAQTMGEKGIENWRAHLGPLPLSAALAIDAKSYAVGRWVSIPIDQEFCVTFDEPGRRGFVIGNMCYSATRDAAPEGRSRYGQIDRMEVSERPAIVDRRK
jgi:hypothetical protein